MDLIARIAPACRTLSIATAPSPPVTLAHLATALNSLPKLEELTLSGISFTSQTSEDDPPPTRASFQLSSLTIDYAAGTQPITISALEWLCGPSPHTLTHLCLTRCSLDLLRGISASLVGLIELRLSLPTLPEPPAEFLAGLVEVVRQLPKLRFARLACCKPGLSKEEWGAFGVETEGVNARRGKEVLVCEFR